MDPRQLALVVLYMILRPRPDNDKHAPSRQQVAWDIGRALGLETHDDADEQQILRVGFGLLHLAAQAGLIRDITRRVSVKGDPRTPARVELTEQAIERLSEYTARFADLDNHLPDDPLRERPTGEIEVKQNRRGKIAPPPLPQPFIDALENIRGTRWRVNQFVLRTMTSKLSNGQWRYLFEGLQGSDWRSSVSRKDRLLALATAQRFRDGTFYLDLHCDWRGRVYQRGPLRYTGAEHMIQALLEFADGEVIQAGINNAAIPLAAYVAATWGEKGSDLRELEKWTLAHEDLLTAVAEDPARNNRWWKLPDKKRWQALAAADAWRAYRAGRPVHLPCSFDASCSGLQVYALLMRDVALGSLVGLTEDSSGTYYEKVAERCVGEDRATAKAVCVPLLYGSSLATSVRDLAEASGSRRNEAKLRRQARLLRAAAEDLAPAFKQVRTWLERSVAPEFRRLNREMRWRTPLGFEVVFDSRVMTGTKVTTWIEGQRRKTIKNGKVHWERRARRVKLVMQRPSERLDHRKQRSGLAANLVHSLDANLLVAIVALSSQRGIHSWGVVHDCFAVHPNHVHGLFVFGFRKAVQRVFGEDWLLDLHRQLEQQAGTKIPAPPKHVAELPQTFGECWGAIRP